MAFGQASGPPASAAQMAELTELFARVGFESFREARHPYGLTQRQSNGKFTRSEADELIERLTAEADGNADGEAEGSMEQRASVAGDPAAHPIVADPAPAVDDVVLAFPDEVLADELRRRGWECSPPQLS
jgi:hypothetical protein